MSSDQTALVLRTPAQNHVAGKEALICTPIRRACPRRPISPNRRLIAGEGAGVGFLLGVTMMLAGRNESFLRLKKALARS